jgi:hypothetical protein
MAVAPPQTSPPAPQPAKDAAKRTWATTKDTNSVAILEDFIRQFGTTPYGSMARARLEELKKSKVAVAAPNRATVGPQAATAKYLGCFKENGVMQLGVQPTGRDLNGSAWTDSRMTGARCIEKCRSQGFSYAGTQYGNQCFCGNRYGGNSSATCDSPCSGNPAEFCGGWYANSIYQIEKRAPQ